MKKRIMLMSILLICCFVLPQMVFGGAWTLPNGSIWIEETVTHRYAKWDFDADRELARKNRNARQTGWDSVTKAEYGIFDWLTILGGITYKESNYVEHNRPPSWGKYDINGHAFTEAEVGLKARILEKPVVLSGQIKIQTYLDGKQYTDPVKGSLTYNSSSTPALHDGHNALEFRGLVGRKFDTAIPFYLGAEAGYSFRNRDVCNGFPLFLEGGFWPADMLLIKGEIDAYLSHDATGSIEKDYAIWRVGPVIRLLGAKGKSQTSSVTREGAFLDLTIQYGNTFWGRNVGKDHMYIVKLAAQF